MAGQGVAVQRHAGQLAVAVAVLAEYAQRQRGHGSAGRLDRELRIRPGRRRVVLHHDPFVDQRGGEQPRLGLVEHVQQGAGHTGFAQQAQATEPVEVDAERGAVVQCHRQIILSGVVAERLSSALQCVDRTPPE